MRPLLAACVALLGTVGLAHAQDAGGGRPGPKPTGADALPPPTAMATFQTLGAKGDGEADDTAALTKALGSGRPLWCNGKFRITAPIVTAVPAGGVYAILGAGRQSCEIVLASKTARLEADIAGTREGGPLHATTQIVLRDVAFTPAAAVTGNPTARENAAFSGVFATSSDPTSGRVDIRNVAILPQAKTAWARYGIYLEQARGAVLDNVRCQGAQAYFYDADSACIYIHGAPTPPQSGADIPEALWISHMGSYNNQFGLKTDEHVEGVIFDDSEVVGGQTGVQIDSKSGATTLVQASHNEINVTDAGFTIVNGIRIQLHDNHVFLSAPKDNGHDAVCFALTGTTVGALFAQIHDNLCEGYERVVSGGHRRIGVQLGHEGLMNKQFTQSQIHDNIFSRIDLGIGLGPTVNNVDVGCNQFMQAGNTQTKLVELEDRNPETTPAYRNYRTCTATPLAAGPTTTR